MPSVPKLKMVGSGTRGAGAASGLTDKGGLRKSIVGAFGAPYLAELNHAAQRAAS
jgi:hypothetical protein